MQILVYWLLTFGYNFHEILFQNCAQSPVNIEVQQYCETCKRRKIILDNLDLDSQYKGRYAQFSKRLIMKKLIVSLAEKKLLIRTHGINKVDS